MKQYLDLLQDIMDNGVDKGDRTGVGTRSVFGRQMRFDLQEGFPALTTKKLHLKSIIHELLWFLAGDTNIKYLNDNGVTIWDEWADENGDLGPVYSRQWRAWPGQARHVSRDEVEFTDYVVPGSEAASYPNGYGNGTTYSAVIQEPIDQIANVVRDLKKNPNSRRLIVSAWNPAEVDQMALPPCHCLFQFYTRPIPLQTMVANAPELYGTVSGSVDDQAEARRIIASKGHPSLYLDCLMYQRSCDTFLGVPFNTASYALLTMMIAQVCKMAPGEFIHTLGDTHLYSNHFEQVEEQLKRTPKKLPIMQINPEVDDIFGFKYEDFQLVGYEADASIKAPIAV